MSFTFTISGRSSVLSTRINPPLILKDDDEYVLGLIDFFGSNSIPNVDKTNQNFYYGNSLIQIPQGSYEIKDIEEYIINHVNKETAINISANLNTLKCEIKCNQVVDFTQRNNIGGLLGFRKRKLKIDHKNISDFPINIQKVNAVCLDCNLITNSYNNEKSVHMLHMFYPNVPPGYKIVEVPKNVIYLPINTRYIDEIVFKINDQNDQLVNFNQELLTIRVHLKKL